MSNGFTLIELLVVLVVMGLMLAAVLPGQLGGSGPLQLRAAARAVAAGLERTRSQAVVTGSEQLFAVDVARHRFQAGEAPPETLPSNIELALRTVRGDAASADVGGIRFFPDGGSTGGGLRLSLDGEVYRIAVRWLTGQVELENAQ